MGTKPRTLLTAALLALTCVYAEADSLSPGSDAPPCLNYVEPGPMVRCDAPTTVPSVDPPRQEAPALPRSETMPRPPTAAGVQNAVGGVSEAEVDAFLANYGKPPREAVRALLNPSDENIRALEAKHQRDEVVRSYMAERWTRIKAESGVTGALHGREVYTVLPHFMGMRFTLYVTPDCGSCARAVESIKRLVQSYPVANAQVAVVSEQEERVLPAALGWQLALPTVWLTPQEARAHGVTHVPAMDVRDTRTRRMQRLVGKVPEPNALRDLVVMMRTKEEHP